MTDNKNGGDIFPAISNNPLPQEPASCHQVLIMLLKQVCSLNFKLERHPKVIALRKRLENREPTKDELAGLKLQLDDKKVTEQQYLVICIEHLIRLAARHNWGLRKDNGAAYIYNGAIWALIDDAELEWFLGKAAEQMGVYVFNSRHYLFREKLRKQFCASAYLTPSVRKTDEVLINLRNGTFEISPAHRRCRPFNRQDFLTYQLPFNYDPAAEAPMFRKYLERVLPDESCQKVLAEYIGYLFFNNRTLKLEKMLLLYGAGANGKSVFFEIITAMLGNENVSNFTLESLTEKNGYYRAKIGTVLVNYASEISTRMDNFFFKQMVSGEPIEARLPYGEPFKLENYAKLIFNCNALPRDVEQSNAYFRRFLIIPFNVTIPEAEQDRQLSSKIVASELSGVFNWVLDGVERLLANRGFTDCKAASEEVAKYRLETDSVAQFIEDNEYIQSTENYILMPTLYREYRCFCEENGFHPLSKPNFRKRLEAKNIVISRINIGNVVYIQKKPLI